MAIVRQLVSSLVALAKGCTTEGVAPRMLLMHLIAYEESLLAYHFHCVPIDVQLMVQD